RFRRRRLSRRGLFGKGAGKVEQVARIAIANPACRNAVYAPNPEFTPIARADLEAIATRAGGVRVFDELAALIDWVGGRSWKTSFSPSTASFRHLRRSPAQSRGGRTSKSSPIRWRSAKERPAPSFVARSGRKPGGSTTGRRSSFRPTRRHSSSPTAIPS